MDVSTVLRRLLVVSQRRQRLLLAKPRELLDEPNVFENGLVPARLEQLLQLFADRGLQVRDRSDAGRIAPVSSRRPGAEGSVPLIAPLLPPFACGLCPFPADDDWLEEPFAKCWPWPSPFELNADALRDWWRALPGTPTTATPSWYCLRNPIRYPQRFSIASRPRRCTVARYFFSAASACGGRGGEGVRLSFA